MLKNTNLNFREFMSELRMKLPPGIRRKIKKRRLLKGTYLVHAGEVSSAVWYFKSGIAHVFFQKGEIKITQDFIFADDLFCVYPGLFMNEPSSVSVQLLTDAKVLMVNLVGWDIRKEKNSVVHEIERVIVSRWFRMMEERSIMRFFTVTEQYLFLHKRHPRLIKHIPSVFLADYLGTSPETISRVRAKVRDGCGVSDQAPFWYLFEKKAFKTGLDLKEFK
ncbi:Crp/Fnr family transcriptional regulator [Gaoshiqia sp. Z1-71]|uniref:Crp/Fnr family transcriptional regulator n=1 Tax=Gaoshiqia hydrogeniformans TaxID=3290090 RepID=UPI003BF82388